MEALYHIEERTTTGWHLVDQARVPMPKEVCKTAFDDLIADGAEHADLARQGEGGQGPVFARRRGRRALPRQGVLDGGDADDQGDPQAQPLFYNPYRSCL